MPAQSNITNASNIYPRTGKRGVPQQFPRRLYAMLENESDKNYQNEHGSTRIIEWSSSGRAFRIDNVSQFASIILPKYFRTNKFSSFQRNLNLYGFFKVRRGPDTDMYANPSFIRGRPESLSHLKKNSCATDRKGLTLDICGHLSSTEKFSKDASIVKQEIHSDSSLDVNSLRCHVNNAVEYTPGPHNSKLDRVTSSNCNATNGGRLALLTIALSSLAD